MRLLLLLPLLFIASLVAAQDKILSVAFLKNDGKHVDNRDSADYFRLVSVPDSGTVLFNVAEYYKDGKRKLIGKTSKVEPIHMEGQCITFFKSGIRKSAVTYKDGIRTGEEYDFFPGGKPYLQLEYPENGDIYNEFTGNYLIQFNYDTLGNKLVENGNGYYKGFDDNFKNVIEEGNVQNGKRDGIWKGLFNENKGHFTENYTNGTLVSGTAVYEDGSISVYNGARGVPPQFKGGLPAFYKYLARNIDYPDDAREKGIQGTVTLSFIVEKDGKLSEIEIKKGIYPLIDNEAIRVMKRCPLWLPGTQYGRAVRTAYDIPINFALSN